MQIELRSIKCHPQEVGLALLLLLKEKLMMKFLVNQYLLLLLHPQLIQTLPLYHAQPLLVQIVDNLLESL
jgi:hypothetical protein